ELCRFVATAECTAVGDSSNSIQDIIRAHCPKGRLCGRRFRGFVLVDACWILAQIIFGCDYHAIVAFKEVLCQCRSGTDRFLKADFNWLVIRRCDPTPPALHSWGDM